MIENKNTAKPLINQEGVVSPPFTPANIKILIVEDEEVICKPYADELRDQGFMVFTAKNGQEGLEVVSRERPDLILLDILMPVMDGLEMMNQLRAQGEYGKNVAIILLTNLSSSEGKIIEAVTKNEPAYYLVKSDWNLSQVVEKIKERLRRRS